MIVITVTDKSLNCQAQVPRLQTLLVLELGEIARNPNGNAAISITKVVCGPVHPSLILP